MLDALSVPGLDFGTTFCVLHPGAQAKLHQLRLFQGWKPILGMYRPPLEVTWPYFENVISSTRNKTLHPWQQDQTTAE